MEEQTLANVLESVLIAEHAALLSGDLAAMSAILERKEQAVARLVSDDLSPVDLTRIKDLSLRNEALLTAVMQAVDAAKSVLNQAAQMPETKTYCADGARETIPTRQNRLTQKV